MNMHCTAPWRVSMAMLLRLGLALMFAAAGAPKIIDPQSFVRAIEGFQLVPALLIPWVALILPWLEILLAAALLCQLWLTATLILTNTVLLLFLGAVLSALWRGLDISCGCFGPSGSAPAQMWLTLGRDLVFILASLALTWLHAHNTALEHQNSCP